LASSLPIVRGKNHKAGKAGGCMNSLSNRDQQKSAGRSSP
jgi:hypothetical protein